MDTPAENQIISILVQGGLASIALVALYIIYKLTTGQGQTLKEIAGEHRASVDRNTDAWIKNTEALTALKESIKR